MNATVHTFRKHCLICAESITEEVVAAKSRRLANERNTLYVVRKVEALQELGMMHTVAD